MRRGVAIRGLTRRPDAVLFDLDGTLVDTMPAFADLAAEIIADRYDVRRPWARLTYLDTSGLPFIQQLESVFRNRPENEAASVEFEARKLAICRAARMDARTVAALGGLRSLGLKLAVSSNTPQAVVDEFSEREEFRFDLALGFDPAAGLAKGGPHIDRALAAFATARDALVFVGDSLKDAELAAENGVVFIGRVGTFLADDFQRRTSAALTVDHIDQLPELMRAFPGPHRRRGG